MDVVAKAFGMSLGTAAEPLALSSELNTPQAHEAWAALSEKHNLVEPDLSALCDTPVASQFCQELSQLC